MFPPSSSSASASSYWPSSWADMVPDALANIFNRLPLRARLMDLPRVCKAWRHVLQVEGGCWQIIDLDQLTFPVGLSHYRQSFSSQRMVETYLSYYREGFGSSHRMVETVLSRSQGCLREFTLSEWCTDGILRLLAKREHSVEVLRIQDSSAVTDACLKQIAPYMPRLIHLNVFGCPLSAVSLEAFGQQCRSITRLELSLRFSSEINDELFAIAKNFPQLKHLVIASRTLSNEGLQSILDNCMYLEYLDLCGCDEGLDRSLLKECQRRVKVFHHPIYNHGNISEYLYPFR